MNFDRMRALLLEQAIQGKLVPQLTTKPHRTLLIKKEQKSVPFAIPEQWIWISAKDAFQLLSGRDLVKSEIFDDLPEGVVYPYITGASQIENSSVLINRWTRNCAVISMKGDLLLTCKGTVGKTAFNTIGDMHIARQIMALRPNLEVIEPKYLKIFIDAIADRLVKEAKSMIPGIDRKTLLNKLIPLPPLEEQSRIVTRLDEAFAEIDRAEKAYQELQTLSSVLRGQILQEAIQGKLVPQLDSEEEVEQIGDAPKEVPFAIPEKWKWVQFKHTCNSLDGKRIPLKKDDRAKLKKIYPYYGATGIIDFVDNYIFDGVFLLIGEDGANLLSRSKDNAFIASGKIWVNNHAHVFEENGIADLRYLALVINATYLGPYVTGSAQPKLTQKNLYSIPIPIPPILEQVRIVGKIEELLKQVDALSGK